ncbi:MFS transporter [Hyphomicrobium sp. xq]|uniref:MFS transporter n=1 Tax=Hyphomicrobium album TaxID=2665159 RepID=A0A6I3KF36_9HYPH|nr:MFS transporter [Hyphomicrobium album]MTD92909.1 MFS transporter [Hyphomicrobium album]
MTSEAIPGRRRALTREERKVIIASSAGTVFEWYDFYLYGALASIIGAQFFAAYSVTQQSIFALLTFAAGFIVRPFGAIIFGRLGDIVGRKYTFVVTVVLMGAATFLVGLLPTYHTIGVAAPIALIVLRMLQGLATGGEYGGAAVYVAEHAPHNQRGFFTSWVNTTPTLALLLSLVVIMFTQIALDAGFPPVEQPDGTTLSAFKAWGWRIPFLLSAVLLLISLYVRLQMQESPAFQRMKAEGAASAQPLREAFGEWRNIKIGLIALFGLVAGQAVVWYTAHFYALFFIQNILQVDQFTTNVLVAWALIAGVGFVVAFASLSDRIGRKPLILGGCLLAVLTYFPLFEHLTRTANPALYRAQSNVEVTVAADPADCAFQFNPTGKVAYSSSCDIAKAALAQRAVHYRNEEAAAGTVASVRIGKVQPIAASDADFAVKVATALAAEGYPNPGHAETVKIPIDPSAGLANVAKVFDIWSAQKLTIIGILVLLIMFAAMTYGPIAAALVELFPTRIRYSGMSLPYHIGNGWFGGLLPATSFAIVAATGNIYSGLWYPVIVAGATVVIGLFLVPETHKTVDEYTRS